MATSKASQTNGKATLWWAIVLGIVIIGGLLLLCWTRVSNYALVCKTQNLQLTAGQSQGAAGTIYQHMVLTNTGRRTCRISGYPTAFLYGSNGFALGNSAAAAAQPAPVNITLDPHASTNTVLGYPQAGNFNPGVCSANSVSLRLYPPSSTTYLEVPVSVAWCPGFSETALQPGS